MGDDRTAALPEGTDTVIEGASKIKDAGPASIADTAFVAEQEIPAAKGDAERPISGGGSLEVELARNSAGASSSAAQASASKGSIAERLRSSSEQLSNQAGEKARGLVSQGLDRSSEALANVAKMVGESASGIEDRLGAEYGDYARRAASSIENVANTIAAKDPDELIEDTRNFVRNSPGIALAGAAVVGFVVARLLKTGIAASNRSDEDDAR